MFELLKNGTETILFNFNLYSGTRGLNTNDGNPLQIVSQRQQKRLFDLACAMILREKRSPYLGCTLRLVCYRQSFEE